MVHLHILDARGRLTTLEERLRLAIAAAVDRIAEYLRFAALDLVVYEEPHSVIPETGFGGYAPSSALVFLSLDLANPNFLPHFGTELPATLAHEFHHCVRWAGPGYGRTLGEALVSEGLACHFELLFRGGQAPFYAMALTSAQLTQFETLALAERQSATYNHGAWFSGAAEKGFPRHTGYALGHYIVGRHIARSGRSAASLAAEPAESFYAEGA